MNIKEAIKVLKVAGYIKKGNKDFVELILQSVFAEGQLNGMQEMSDIHNPKTKGIAGAGTETKYDILEYRRPLKPSKLK